MNRAAMLRFTDKTFKEFRGNSQRNREIDESKIERRANEIILNAKQTSISNAVENAVFEDLKSSDLQTVGNEKLAVQQAFDFTKRTSDGKQQYDESDQAIIGKVKRTVVDELQKRNQIGNVSDKEVESSIMNDLSNAKITNIKLALQQTFDFVRQSFADQHKELNSLKCEEDIGDDDKTKDVIIHQKSIRSLQTNLVDEEVYKFDKPTGVENIEKISLQEQLTQTKTKDLVAQRDATIGKQTEEIIKFKQDLYDQSEVLQEAEKEKAYLLAASTKKDQHIAKLQHNLEIENKRTQKLQVIIKTATNGMIKLNDELKIKLSKNEKDFVTIYNQKRFEVDQIKNLNSQIEQLKAEKDNLIKESFLLKKNQEIKDQKLVETSREVKILRKKISEKDEKVSVALESHLKKSENNKRFLKEDFAARNSSKTDKASLKPQVQSVAKQDDPILQSTKIDKAHLNSQVQSVAKQDDLPILKSTKIDKAHLNSQVQSVAKQDDPPILQSTKIDKAHLNSQVQSVAKQDDPPILKSTKIDKAHLNSQVQSVAKQDDLPILKSTKIDKAHLNSQVQSVAKQDDPPILQSTKIDKAHLNSQVQLVAKQDDLPILKSTKIDKAHLNTQVQSVAKQDDPSILKSTKTDKAHLNSQVQSVSKQDDPPILQSTKIDKAHLNSQVQLVAKQDDPPILKSTKIDKAHLNSQVQSVAKQDDPPILQSTKTDKAHLNSQVQSVAKQDDPSILKSTKIDKVDVKPKVQSIAKQHTLENDKTHPPNYLYQKRSYSDVLKSTFTTSTYKHHQQNKPNKIGQTNTWNTGTHKKSNRKKDYYAKRHQMARTDQKAFGNIKANSSKSSLYDKQKYATALPSQPKTETKSDVTKQAKRGALTRSDTGAKSRESSRKPNKSIIGAHQIGRIKNLEFQIVGQGKSSKKNNAKKVAKATNKYNNDAVNAIHSRSTGSIGKQDVIIEGKVRQNNRGAGGSQNKKKKHKRKKSKTSSMTFTVEKEDEIKKRVLEEDTCDNGTNKSDEMVDDGKYEMCNIL